MWIYEQKPWESGKKTLGKTHNDKFDLLINKIILNVIKFVNTTSKENY